MTSRLAGTIQPARIYNGCAPPKQVKREKTHIRLEGGLAEPAEGGGGRRWLRRRRLCRRRRRRQKAAAEGGGGEGGGGRRRQRRQKEVAAAAEGSGGRRWRLWVGPLVVCGEVGEVRCRCRWLLDGACIPACRFFFLGYLAPIFKWEFWAKGYLLSFYVIK